MSTYIHAIETALPAIAYPQNQIFELLKEQPELDRLAKRLITSIYNASAIDQRYSVINDYQRGPEEEAGVFYDPSTGHLLKPTTGQRNEVYITEATKLFTEAAQKALEASPSFTAADVTHVVTVSCTGFFAPGPEYKIVRALGLAPSVARYHVGFMGCYAAFPALKMAKAFCEADPNAVVLVVCAELCTLHLHSAGDPDTLIANSVFADGAAAALVSARTSSDQPPVLRMDQFETVLTPEGVGEKEMAWKVGDQGYDMVLSTYVPAIIEEHIQGALTPHFSAQSGLAMEDIKHWAVHPGGRSILDKVQVSLSLTDEQMQPSREVLRQYGNMSSVTILFILRTLLHQAQPNERMCAMAFGPGLTVESGVLTSCSGLD